ncbi:acyl-CoA thioesterase [Thetidibacter halocola]|uniref:Acyl-CoA thioesterase n=1 Tax=Thetidibacter halocola TaxID=2827239 RepID=A0A8J7WBD3_9RHOB|nr:thioesterase family protein [Thetidibacter halocola]MBS0122586.1 acyl-CoA thioesterase [Thetidibacter halocola]
MTIYKLHLQVLCHHCDATGIVHFPRYSEMAMHVVESWFDEALDWSFARMIGGESASVPVVRCDAEYPRASRLGDHLVWRLSVQRIGRSAIDLDLAATCGGEARVKMALTLVLSDLDVIRPRHWPEGVRARMADYLSGAFQG